MFSLQSARICRIDHVSEPLAPTLVQFQWESTPSLLPMTEFTSLYLRLPLSFNKTSEHRDPSETCVRSILTAAARLHWWLPVALGTHSDPDTSPAPPHWAHGSSSLPFHPLGLFNLMDVLPPRGFVLVMLGQRSLKVWIVEASVSIQDAKINLPSLKKNISFKTFIYDENYSIVAILKYSSIKIPHCSQQIVFAAGLARRHLVK